MVNCFSPRHLLVAITIAALHQLTTSQFSPTTAPQYPFSFPPTTQSPSPVPPPFPESRSTLPPPLPSTVPTFPPRHPKTRSTAPSPLPKSRSTVPPPLPSTVPTIPPQHLETRSTAPPPLPESKSTAPPQLPGTKPTTESSPPEQIPTSAPTVGTPEPSRAKFRPRNHPLSPSEQIRSSAPTVETPEPSRAKFRPRNRPLSPLLPPSPPPTVETEQENPQEQLVRKVIDALNNAGNFQVWASLLTAMNLSRLPFDATFFIPADEALSHIPAAVPGGFISFDPFIVPYHIVPGRLCFADLLLCETNTKLPTLLPSNFIVITNNSWSNFTIDGSLITNPDVYKSAGLCVHGIKTILDYSVFGGENQYSVSAQVPPIPKPETPKTAEAPYFPAKEDDDVQKSGSACLYTDFPVMHLAAILVGIVVIVGGGFTRPIWLIALIYYLGLWRMNWRYNGQYLNAQVVASSDVFGGSLGFNQLKINGSCFIC